VEQININTYQIMRKHEKMKSQDYRGISTINAIFITLSQNQRKWEWNSNKRFRV